jgi:hypothetical protein
VLDYIEAKLKKVRIDQTYCYLKIENAIRKTGTFDLKVKNNARQKAKT